MSPASSDPSIPAGPELPRTGESEPPPLVYGNLELRSSELQALLDGHRIPLTVREFEVLFALAEHHDRVVPRPRVYAQVWGGEMKHRERAVDVFVRKIRNKLAEASPGWLYIHTHFGRGYRFAPERTEQFHVAPRAGSPGQ